MDTTNFIPSDFSPFDFGFLKDASPQELQFFFDLTDLSLEALAQTLDQDNTYITDISRVGAMEMLEYHRVILDVYKEYDPEHDIDTLEFIIEYLEKYLEKTEGEVGNMGEKP